MTQQTRTAIVTGASRGIGAEIARALAADGIAVVVNYANSAGAAEDLVTEIVEQGGRAVAICADISDPAAPASLFEQAEAAFGSVDILINNAGMMQLAPISEAADQQIDTQFALNLAGPIRMMREAATRIGSGGRIINLSSSVVGLYQPGYGIYAATKAGIEALTHVLAKELGPKEITVNAVAPGPVGTDFFLAGKSDALVDQIRKMNPFGRLGTPGDIARVVRFLASEEAAWISGQVVRANGGVI
ncbi:MAG: SDR family oxidoreductase [Rhodobacteraceae bacterium]|nr:SDR family oxidoreductase [Paracoccaceae bacterium]MBR9822820.1 SDR family oxidoreductase [Paracoccaceae bacterium]